MTDLDLKQYVEELPILTSWSLYLQRTDHCRDSTKSPIDFLFMKKVLCLFQCIIQTKPIAHRTIAQ